jgi:hypothetical protein
MPMADAVQWAEGFLYGLQHECRKQGDEITDEIHRIVRERLLEIDRCRSRPEFYKLIEDHLQESIRRVLDADTNDGWGKLHRRLEKFCEENGLSPAGRGKTHKQ